MLRGTGAINPLLAGAASASASASASVRGVDHSSIAHVDAIGGLFSANDGTFRVMKSVLHSGLVS